MGKSAAAFIASCILMTLLPAAQAASPAIEVDVHYDASTAPPTMTAVYRYDTGFWTNEQFWLVQPGARLVSVEDEQGPLQPRVDATGIARATATYAAGSGEHTITWHLEMPALKPFDGGFARADLDFTADPNATLRLRVTAPANQAWLASSTGPGTVVLRGSGSVALLLGPAGSVEGPTAPPGTVGDRLVTLQDLSVDRAGSASLVTTTWLDPKRWNPSLQLGAYDGWRLVSAEDSWGPLVLRNASAAGAEATARGVAGLAEVRATYVLDSDAAHPLAKVRTPLPEGSNTWYLRLRIAPGGRDAVFLSNDGLVDGVVYGPRQAAIDVAVDKGLASWSRASAAPFHIFARDATLVQPTVQAAGLAAAPLLRALGDAGLPARTRVATVVLSGSHPSFSVGWEAAHWSGWGMDIKDEQVRIAQANGTLGILASTIVHEAFHAAQFDVGEAFFKASWWTEGSADDGTYAALPQEDVCSFASAPRPTTCYWRRITPGDLDLYYRQGFAPASWLSWHTALGPQPANGTHWGYGVSAFLVGAYRAQAGDAAYRAVWKDIAQRPGCCFGQELVDLALRHAPQLRADDLERPWASLRASDPAAFLQRVAPYVAGYAAPPEQGVLQGAPDPANATAPPAGGAPAASNSTLAQDLWDPAFWARLRTEAEARQPPPEPEPLEQVAPPPPPPPPLPDEPLDEPGPEAALAMAVLGLAAWAARRTR